MALEKYKQKRSFNQTPEPTGGKSRGGKLIFVVQKHDASHLHYDFRLEMGGVLKSWAVPKGPSLNPADKRLAMMVEDHPFDYKDFEGVIPKGNYGAGTVIVWDHGTYEPIVPVKSRVEAEKQLLKQLKAGSLKVNLHGQKLNGEFALVHTHGRGENSWLLIKHRDKYSSDQDVTLKDKSVISGKTLAKMEKAPDKIYGRKTIPPGTTEKDRPSANRKKAVEKINKVTSVTAVKKTAKKPAVSKVDLSDAPRSSFPKTIRPMLATLVDKPVDQEGWLYEIKWDGYRAVALCNGSNVEIISRNNKPFNEKFYPVHEALQQLGLKAVLDGEIAVLRDTGITSFGDLQNWRSEADGELVYYVFDLLWLNGHNLMQLPLIRRRELLHEVLPKEGIIRESESFETTATEFYAAAMKMGLEGFIAKKADSPYIQGDRGRQWLKIKVLKRHDPPHAEAFWLEPELVCEVGYTEITEDGVMRHPSFEGMREDKNAKDVHAEVAAHTEDVVVTTAEKKAVTKARPAKPKTAESPITVKPVMKGERKTLLNPKEETQVKLVSGHELKFGNLSKLYWPKDGYTKRDLLNYYYQVAPYILPYLKDRPQSMNRFPNGIEGKSFYHKDVTATAPDWVKQFPYHTSDGEDKNFLVVEDDASLLWMASLGAIEMNPWNSTIHKPDNPDWCIIDLDPTEKIRLNR